MSPRTLSPRVDKEADERLADKYERQAARNERIAYRHTRLAVEAAARGDEARSRFEIAQSKLAWNAVHIDRERAAALRNRPQ